MLQSGRFLQLSQQLLPRVASPRRFFYHNLHNEAKFDILNLKLPEGSQPRCRLSRAFTRDIHNPARKIFAAGSLTNEEIPSNKIHQGYIMHRSATSFSQFAKVPETYDSVLFSLQNNFIFETTKQVH